MFKLLLYVSLITIGCVGPSGINGLNGIDGINGIDGLNGQSCSVTSFPESTLIHCTDGTSSVIMHGHPAPYEIVEIIAPCHETGSKELLLRLRNGDILAHYSHGVRQYLTYLSPGTWQLTDGTSCVFTVHSNMSVTW